MKILKIVLAVLAVAFVVAQFFRPEKNAGDADAPTALHRVYNVPPDVQGLLRNSCYDCHSNATRYPWYAEVMPAGWLLADHVKEGRKHLNFSEFGKYRLQLQSHKLDEMGRVLEEGEMPLPSYLLIHHDAKLSPEQTARLIAWTQEMRDTLDARQSEE